MKALPPLLLAASLALGLAACDDTSVPPPTPASSVPALAPGDSTAPAPDDAAPPPGESVTPPSSPPTPPEDKPPTDSMNPTAPPVPPA